MWSVHGKNSNDDDTYKQESSESTTNQPVLVEEKRRDWKPANLIKIRTQRFPSKCRWCRISGNLHQLWPMLFNDPWRDNESTIHDVGIPSEKKLTGNTVAVIPKTSHVKNSAMVVTRIGRVIKPLSRLDLSCNIWVRLTGP